LELLTLSSESEKIDLLINSIKNKTNIQILLLLSTKPSFTREIADVLNLDESIISRRLKLLEQLGIVRSRWKRIGGKNVKVHELSVEGFSVRFDRGALEVTFSKREKYSEAIRLKKAVVPECKELVGREREISTIRSSKVPIVHLWGLPGVGKSSLAAWYVKRYRERDPVYWYVPAPSDTAETLKLKLALFISTAAGLDARSVVSSDAQTLANILNERSAVLVFDDFHNASNQVREFVLSLAERIEHPARVFVISRAKERGLPYSEGRVLDLEVKPLPLSEALELAGKLSEELGASLTQRDVLQIAEQSGGIPLLIRGAINLHKSTGMPPAECAKRVAASYYDSEIGGMIGEDDMLLLEALIAGGGVLPVDAVCDAVSLRQAVCSRRLSQLERLGLVEMLEEDVKLREGVERLPKVASAQGVALVRRVAMALSRHPDAEHRVRGLLLMADNCLASDAVAVIEKRLLHGSSWITCCLTLYHSALEKLQGCKGLTARQKSILAVEKALVEITTGGADARKAAGAIEKHLALLRASAPLYARAAALLAGMLAKIGRLDEGRELLEESKRLLQRLPPGLRRVIEPTVLASDTVMALYENDLERALDDSAREARLELERGDLGNYAVALLHVGVIQAYLGKVSELKDTLAEMEEVSELLPSELGGRVKAQASVLSVFALMLEGSLNAARARLEEVKKSKHSSAVESDLLWEEAALDYLAGDAESARELAKRAIEGNYRGISSDELVLLRAILGDEPSKEEAEKLPKGMRMLLQLIESRRAAGAG